MFCGVKLTLLEKLLCGDLLENPRLKFDKIQSTETQEIKRYTSIYKSLRIQLFNSGRIQIDGSLHSYFNDGFHNYNDFTISNLKDVLSSLYNELGIDPFKASINNLEFGFNIVTPFNPNALIHDLLCFKWHQFDMMKIKGAGYGKECKAFFQYKVKIYNKALRYGQPGNILRIEKKVNTMFVLKVGQLNLSDLLNPDLWQHCKIELITMVGNILINEPIYIDLLTKNEQRIYNKVVNQSNWAEFSIDQKKRYKKAFNNIIDKCGMRQYRAIIIDLINKKFDRLINP